MQDRAARQRTFEECVRQHHGGLYRTAYRLTGREAIAVELVQETYLQAWQGLDSLREPNRMRAWLFGILRRQYLKTIRRKSEHLATDLPGASAADALGNHEGPAEAWLAQRAAVPSEVLAMQQSDLIQWALDQLEEKYRMVILLQMMEDFSVREISETLDLPEGTVLSHLHRGKHRLREILEREAQQSALRNPT